MYTLIKSIPFLRLIAEQVPALGISFLLAEIFYKFQSFTLECLAFLVTWYIADFVIQSVRKWSKEKRAMTINDH